MQNLRILIVEEELMISEYLSVSLREKGFDVIGTPISIDEAIERFRDSRPDLVIMDIQWGGQPEIVKAAQTIRGEFQMGLSIVFLTTFPVEWPKTEPPENGIVKPFSEIDLRASIERALRNSACHET